MVNTLAMTDAAVKAVDREGVFTHAEYAKFDIDRANYLAVLKRNEIKPSRCVSVIG